MKGRSRPLDRLSSASWDLVPTQVNRAGGLSVPDDKTALVTGGRSRIGMAIARAPAETGTRVFS